jgi:hypothetical protein
MNTNNYKTWYLEENYSGFHIYSPITDLNLEVEFLYYNYFGL